MTDDRNIAELSKRLKTEERRQERRRKIRKVAVTSTIVTGAGLGAFFGIRALNPVEAITRFVKRTARATVTETGRLGSNITGIPITEGLVNTLERAALATRRFFGLGPPTRKFF